MKNAIITAIIGLFAVSVLAGVSAFARTIECDGFIVHKDKLTESRLAIKIVTTTDPRMQRVQLYEIDQHGSKRLIGGGTLQGTLEPSVSCPVHLDLGDHQVYNGALKR